MSAFTTSRPDFRDIETLSLTVSEGRIVLTVNGLVCYDGTDKRKALTEFANRAPRMRYGVVSRETAGLPSYS